MIKFVNGVLIWSNFFNEILGSNVCFLSEIFFKLVDCKIKIFLKFLFERVVLIEVNVFE